MRRLQVLRSRLSRSFCSGTIEPVIYFNSFEKSNPSESLTQLIEESTKQHGRPPVNQSIKVDTNYSSTPFEFPRQVMSNPLNQLESVSLQSEVVAEVKSGDECSSNEAEAIPTAPPAITAESEQKYFKCSKCARMFRLLDAVQTHIKARHDGDAEVVQLGEPPKEVLTSKSKKDGSSMTSIPTSVLGMLSQSARRPAFPPVPVAQCLTPEESMPLPSFVTETESTTESLRHSENVVSELGHVRKLLQMDAVVPDDADAGAHPSCVAQMHLVGALQRYEEGKWRGTKYLQLFVACDGEYFLVRIPNENWSADFEIGTTVAVTGELRLFQEYDDDSCVQYQIPIIMSQPSLCHIFK